MQVHINETSSNVESQMKIAIPNDLELEKLEIVVYAINENVPIKVSDIVLKVCAVIPGN